MGGSEHILAVLEGKKSESTCHNDLKKKKEAEAGSSQMPFLLGAMKRPLCESGQRDIWGHKGQNSDSVFS